MTDPLIFYLLPVGLVVFASILYLFCRDFKVPNLDNKCVVITGCDTGFGHQLAITLDALGLHVFAGCLTEEGEHELQTKCSERLQTVRMDVTKSEDIQRCLECVKGFLETVDNTVLWAVVNNAGIDICGLVDWTSTDTMKKVFDVNLWGLLDVTKAFLPLLKKSKGRIVNVASVAGKLALAGAGAYSGSKYTVQCYSDVLRRELWHFGVGVHIIDPGFFKTNMTNSAAKCKVIKQLWENLSEEKREEYGQKCLNEALKLTEMLQYSQDMRPVVDAMEHAVTSSHPKIRYLVGWDHRLLWRWLAMLPSGLQDVLFLHLLPVPKASVR
ncbi:retinol dehydrogenase 2 [Exaiptasia diaphana]|uniref:Uncharacterized protein n=1 Tax=Exaiptasia diaphana TaxID=2652724 RepID=A0A913XBB8_EXADI|nr:retinol dehydrogenase 2 [Exaiptasia diaphana]KXJ13319.1 Retinol dehydrogenase 2 [Exaiptasia diaphana]